MRKFYTIQAKDKDNPYEVAIFLANNIQNMQILLESNFAFSIGMDIRLYSVDVLESQRFEAILSDNSYNYKSYDLNSAYEEWKSSTMNIPKVLDSSFIDNDQEQIICEYSFPEIRETENGTVILNEEEICRKDCIKIYTHSNENCGHHVPHVHVAYNDNRNFCVISLIDKSVIEPVNCRRAKAKKAVQLLNEHFNEAVDAWNRTTGHCKI